MPAIMLNIFIGVNMPPRTPKAGLKGAIQKREKMKRHKRNKKATTSANVMAGIRINSGRLNKLAADITKIINEACP